MTVKLSDVPGLMIKEKEQNVPRRMDRIIANIFNLAIFEQGAVEIGLNRERLAKKIWEQKKIKNKYWENEKENFRAITFRECFVIADAIISDLKGLIEVKE